MLPLTLGFFGQGFGAMGSYAPHLRSFYEAFGRAGDGTISTMVSSIPDCFPAAATQTLNCWWFNHWQ